jgi:tetratricopeptide (TPR) repeat protein
LIRDWEKGKENFLKCIQLNPEYSFGHYLFGLYYYAWVTGEKMEAEKHGQIAIQLEPLSSITHAIHSLILLACNKPDEAMAMAIKAIELDPNSFLCYRAAVLSSFSLGRPEETVDFANRLIALSNRHPHAVIDLMLGLSILGKTEEVNSLMEELIQRSANEYINSSYMALAYVYNGDFEKAFEHFDLAFDENDPLLITFKYCRYSEALINHPKYPALLDKIGFPK